MPSITTGEKMRGIKFKTYSNNKDSFTVVNWVAKQRDEAKAVEELDDVRPTYISFGIKSLIDAALAVGLSALTKPIGKIMNLDVSNPFLVIIGVMLMIIPLFLPLVFVFRGTTFGILQYRINKKIIGLLGAILSILALGGCLYLWYLGLLSN